MIFLILPVAVGFFLGACFGSFSSALLWRVPRRIPWAYERDPKTGRIAFVRSCCPSCKRTLSGRDLVPVFSWMWQKGTCRTCHTKISAFYPALEIGSGLIGALLFAVLGVGVLAVLLLLGLIFLGVFLWTGLVYHIWARDLVGVLLILFFIIFFLGSFTGF
ncbi:MAG: prepilin peptidase [Rhodospirillales bacterium]|nr:prepilin peptidase [Rhodospirillales bacterium]